jgi:hypothetical protein
MIEEGSIIEFCKRWLTAWTGNRPETLLEFYSGDAFYIDPAHPQGLKGHKQLRPYFTKLLAANPNWKWETIEVYPTQHGFILKWRANIPIADTVIIEYGMDIVELENGKVTRNEVYFDRTRWLTILQQKKK